MAKTRGARKAEKRRAGSPSRATWKDRTLEVRRLPPTGYREALALQATLVERRRRAEIPDTLVLLEHPHIVTLGSAGGREHLLLSPAELAARGIEVHEAGRGGDATYHGPGQLVGYPVLDLKPDRKDVHAYLRSLERVVIGALRALGVESGRVDGLTGVWAWGAKVAAIGIRLSSGWITSHGFAVNANTDLSYFDAIVPCGLRGRSVTSVTRLARREVTPAMIAPALVAATVREFGYGSVRNVSSSRRHIAPVPPESSGLPSQSSTAGGANSK